MKFVLALIVLAIIFALLLPMLHLLLSVAVLAAGVIVVMAAWKVLFGSHPAGQGQGGPPAIR